ncbi:hypothetical protein AMQ83_14075, partial [Paenibacillus riograndensis]
MSAGLEEFSIKQTFMDSLINDSLTNLQTIPKSDLHNHAGHGGTIQYIGEWANIQIQPPSKPFQSLHEMQKWFDEHIKCPCPGIHGYLKRIEASFVQAAGDHIEKLALSFGFAEIDSVGGMAHFSRIIDDLPRSFAPKTRFLSELALALAFNIDEVYGLLYGRLASRWVVSLVIWANEIRH